MSATEISKVEEYCKFKGWNYQASGDQILVEQCPFCLKSDYKFFINSNNFLWDCKHGKCQRSGNEWVLKNALGDQIDKVTNPQESGTVERERIPDVLKMHENLMDNMPLLNWLTDTRGWSVETIIAQKIGISNRWLSDLKRELPCFVYPYFSGKNCNFVKWRSIPSTEPDLVGYKGFASLKGWDVPLYNSNCVEKDMDHLILVEGEADTISVLNIGEQSVAGVPGAALKKVTWDKLLEMPKKLYLLFDSDQAGQDGAKNFADRFGVDKFHNIVLPEFELLEPINEDGDIRTKGKDVTEWIQAGGTLEDLHQLMKDATPFDVEGVSSIDQSLTRLSRSMTERGTNLPKYDSPWRDVNRVMGGAEDRHLIIIQAPKKTGKTTMAINWADYLVDYKNVNVYLECLEMDDEQLSRKWASYRTRTPDTPGKSQMTPEVIERAKKIARDREYSLLFGAANYTKLDEVFARWRTIIRRYGVKVIIFDNLQLLTDLLHNERMGNRHGFMSKLTKKFKAFAMEMNILFILIAQAKRNSDSDGIADADTLEGSSSPGNDCDTMLILNRVKQLDVKKADDLRRSADIETTAALDPTLYVECGLSRFATGGRARLYIEGDISWIRDLNLAEEVAVIDAVNMKTLAGAKFIPAQTPATATTEAPSL